VGEGQLESPTRWKYPIEVNCEGHSDENGDSRAVKAPLSWISGDLMNISDLGDLEFSAILSTNSTISPLYSGLIKTDVGKRFMNTRYFPRVRNPYSSIGLDGFDPAFTKFNETVLALLTQIDEKGFRTNRVLS
jgi:Zn-dependent M16 (insulinase) family peptidase